LTAEDADVLAATVPAITMCSPLVSGREQLVSSGRNWNTRYQGVLPAFFEIRRRGASEGTLFSEADETHAARVLVLGEVVARELFGDESPLGRTVRMNRFPFQVIGVLAARGTERGGVDRDDVAFVPFSTAGRSLDRRDWVSDVMCAVSTPEALDAAEADAVAVLRERHHLDEEEPDDFQIQRPIEALEMRASAARTMTVTLTAIGAVSLVVGGVGIMNIMLVAVTERKREIGLRLAVGARLRDIRWQFLVEAVTIGLAGGVCGIGLGWLGASILSSTFGWEAIVTREVVMLATVSALIAALVFGYYPAHRASLLDPIEALRIEG
jgi:putative ABC transport system permease protein